MFKFLLNMLVYSVFLFTPAYSSSISAPVDLKIATFNVLASCWAAPKHFPANPSNPENPYDYVTNMVYRLSRIKQEITELKSQNVDVFCLQEMTQETFEAIASTLGKDYLGFMAFHDISYWSSWQIDPDHPMRNGNATFINQKKWQIVSAKDVPSYPQDGSGNHALYAQIKKDSHVFHLMNMHLSDNDAEKRKQELEGGLALMAPSFAFSDHTQVIVGDLNATSERGSIHQPLASNGFVNLKRPLEITHPFVDNDYKCIDHILVKNGTPAEDAVVRNHGLWDVYPILNINTDTNNPLRMAANIDICGSDHFSVVGTLRSGQ